MFGLSPLTLAIVITGIVAVVGFALHVDRRDAALLGFETLRHDLRRIRRKVGGEYRREGQDLIIRGEWRRLPLALRFSHRDDAPALHLHMAAAATFSLFLAPRGAAAAANMVRLPAAGMGGHFDAYSKTPTETQIFTSMGKAKELLRSLDNTHSTSIGIERGAIELAQMVLPQRYVARGVLRQLSVLGELAGMMEKMPGSSAIAVPRMRRYSVAGRAAILVGLVAVVGVVASASYEPLRHEPAKMLESTAPRGMRVAEAARIPLVYRWQVITADDCDPVGVEWLKEQGLEPQGRIPLDLEGKGSPLDVAYVLTRADHAMRVVVLLNGGGGNDVTYPSLAAVVKVPANALAGIEWSAPPQATPEGEALMLIMKLDDPKSAIVLFSRHGHIYSGAPADYQRISLQ